METVLYVFSTTGNCLTTARLLAQGLENARVLRVQTPPSAPVRETARSVGFVFPVYYGNLPYPLRAFVEQMEFSPEAYIFCVTTFRGREGEAPEHLDRLLRRKGQRLQGSFRVPMPGNSFITTEEDARECFDRQGGRVSALLEPIAAREENFVPTGAELPETPVDAPGNFRGITADETCVGCGLCARVCPMGNIIIREGRAVIGDNCATCLACFHWCPRESVWMSLREDIARRVKYRHPDVTAEDFLVPGRE